MSKKQKISPENLLEKFTSKKIDLKTLKYISTPQISDAMKKLNLENTSIKGVKPRTDNKLVGKAVTVKTDSYDWGTVVKAIEIAKKDQVIVIGTDEDDQALWGELTSKMAQEKGLSGTVVMGAARDIAAIRSLNYPLFSSSIISNAGDPLNEGEVNVPIKCGNLEIKPGDIVIGDDCGVLVIPKPQYQDVIKETLNIKKQEKEILDKIEKGFSLSEILGL
ncbi:MAG: RraA family protein [Methanobacteriaceae archaeon]|jgi:3-hexulose-6-phosphate synthase|nr:RraA family protein [Methanobacteriaceae archaeon]